MSEILIRNASIHGIDGKKPQDSGGRLGELARVVFLLAKTTRFSREYAHTPKKMVGFIAADLASLLRDT